MRLVVTTPSGTWYEYANCALGDTILLSDETGPVIEVATSREEIRIAVLRVEAQQPDGTTRTKTSGRARRT
jgi:hypothetical protein